MNSNQGSMTSDLIVYVAILALACVQVFVLKGHLFAMLSVARHGFPKKVLESKDIRSAVTP